MTLSQIGSLRSLLFLTLVIVSRIVSDGRYQFWKVTTFEQWSCFGAEWSLFCSLQDDCSAPVLFQQSFRLQVEPKMKTIKNTYSKVLRYSGHLKIGETKKSVFFVSNEKNNTGLGIIQSLKCRCDVSGSQLCLAKDPYSGPSAHTHLTLRTCLKKILGNSKRIQKISKIELSRFRILLF